MVRMKAGYYLIILLLTGLNVYAQDTGPLIEDKITPDVTVKYHTLKTDRRVLDGMYQAFYKKKTVIASGAYSQGKPLGTWHFFNKAGKPVQQYNYTTQTLRYEAPDDSASAFKYVVDHEFTAKDIITKPIKIGGRYFGYLPYLNLFRLPQDFYDANPGFSNYGLSAYIELLVSPVGRLADFRVHITSPVLGERVLAVKIDRLSDADKTFFPATINGEEIPCRIAITCKLNNSGRLEL